MSNPALSDALALEWRDGAPPKPWSEEWFIAETTYGDRAVLRALPDDWSYDFKTADDTHMKAENVKRWMQFPDSAYIAPDAAALGVAPRHRASHTGDDGLAAWERLKQLCCADPAKATRCVSVSKGDFLAALTPPSDQRGEG